jgi:hypothetical protein
MVMFYRLYKLANDIIPFGIKTDIVDNYIKITIYKNFKQAILIILIKNTYVNEKNVLMTN